MLLVQFIWRFLSDILMVSHFCSLGSAGLHAGPKTISMSDHRDKGLTVNNLILEVLANHTVLI